MQKRKSILPESATINIYASAEFKEEIKNAAEAQQRSISSFICIVLKEFLKNNNK